jgi:DNA-directed RNA polymerase subunit RPC12/RpoP
MRTLMQPPPTTHCDHCGGELLLKLVESANRALDLENEIFVCASCGREISLTVNHDRYAAHTTPGLRHTDAKSLKS